MPHIGDFLAEMLMQYDVDYVFGMPGGQTTALHDGISRRSPKIQHVLVRDERSSAYAADAYARLTGKPGICDVTVGPGTTKLPDGLVEALNASIPMIALALPLFIVAIFVSGFWVVPVALFAVGWIFQFIGHAFERKPPEFFKDWRFLLVGLRWWFKKIKG